MEVSTKGIEFIKKREGLRLTSYQDEAGVWTIGYGTTGRGNYPFSISSIQAEQYLRDDLRKIEKALEQMILVDVMQQEFDALASLCYNIGKSALSKSTLIRCLNLGEPKEKVAGQFLRWNKITIGGEKVPSKGLSSRREAERQLFLHGFS